jgi:PAS domain-containing protein
MLGSSPLWPSLRGAIPHYVVAVLAVAAAVAVGLLVDRFLQSAPFVSLFLCAILFAAWLGGLGPGLLATGLAILTFDYFFIPPMHSFATGVQGGLRVALFTVTALFVVWVSVAQKRTAESLRRARDDLRATVAELRRSETYLAEAQRLSNTGSFGWKIGTDESFWSKQTYRIMGFDETVRPTTDLLLQRVHPDDRGFVQQQLDRALRGEQHFDYEYRLRMPNGEIKHIHVRAHRQAYEAGEQELRRCADGRDCGQTGAGSIANRSKLARPRHAGDHARRDDHLDRA